MNYICIVMKHLQVNKAQTFLKREENKEIKTMIFFYCKNKSLHV